MAQYDLTVPYARIPQPQGGGLISGIAQGLGEYLDNRNAAAAYTPYLDSVYGAKPQRASTLSQLFGLNGPNTAQSNGGGSMAMQPPLGPSPEAQAGRKSLAALLGFDGGQPQQPANIPTGPDTAPPQGTRLLSTLDTAPAPQQQPQQPRIPREAIERLLAAGPEGRRMAAMLMPGGEFDYRQQRDAYDRDFQERKLAADTDYRNRSFAADQDYRGQSLDIQRKAYEQGRMPPGYMAAPGGTGYTYVPGGPEDPQTIKDQATARATRKPIPPAIQKMDADDLADIQGVTSVNDMLGRFRGQIEGGKLQLGPMTNFISGAQNWAGTSSENSRNFASFQTGLERLRNDSLRLNKGVQTEGDAQRAWNELLANINDPKVVMQRIDEIRDLNNRAAQFRRSVIDQRRTDNGLDPIDVDRIVPGSGTQPSRGRGGGGAAPPAGAVSALRQNPALAQQFDAKYGRGAAAQILGGR